MATSAVDFVTAKKVPWRGVTSLLLGKDDDRYILYALYEARGIREKYALEPFLSLLDAVISAASMLEHRNKKRAKKLTFTVTGDVFHDCGRINHAYEIVTKYQLHDIANLES